MICPLYQRALDHPSDPFIITTGQGITYLDMHLYVIACSKILNDHPKDRPFAIVGSDPLMVISWLFAAARTNRIIAITSTKDPKEIRDQFLTSLNIEPQSQYWAFPHATHPLETSIIFEIHAPQSPLCILLTSGSSGQPKAVVHSFYTLWSAATFSNNNIGLSSGDRWLLSLSLWHIGGLMIPIRALLGGASIVVKVHTLGEHIERDSITHLSLVSTQLNDLLQESRDFSSLTAVLVGGGTIPPGLIDTAVEKNIPIHTTYGMTELGSQLCTTPPNAPIEILRSAGYALGDWQIHITEQSEISVQGSPLFLGYWKRDHIDDARDSNGYFHTGDTGYISDGLLYPIGRVDQMFISGGENIHPEEIEQVLGSRVRTVVVVSIPNVRYGQRPVAFIDQIITEDLLDEINTLLKERLPTFKHPDHFLEWPNHIPTHKPPRIKLQQIAEQLLTSKIFR